MSKPLRIFLSCQQDLQLHPVPAYRFWVSTFRNALREAGHVCLEAPQCDWAEGLLPRSADEHARWRQSTWNKALDWLSLEHKRAPVDLFLGYLYPSQVDGAAVAQIRSLGIPCVNFFCDNVRLFRNIPREYGVFDLHWVPEYKGCQMYSAAGLPFIFAPMPCWIPVSMRSTPERESLPPTFVGTRDEQRERLFRDALQLGLKIELRGKGWSGHEKEADAPPRGAGRGLWANQADFLRRHGLRALLRKLKTSIFPPRPVAFDFSPYAGKPCDADGYWNALREASVCVGVNRYPSFRFPADRPDCYSRLRDLEAPMAGAAYLTEAAPELPFLYDLGKEIEVYSSPEELVETTNRLLGDPSKRQALRLAAQRRALSDHSVARTMDKIAERLGL